MTTIAGIVLDVGHAAAGRTHAMFAAMSARCRGKASVYSNGAIELGQGGAQPFADEALIVVADARLDNLPELRLVLGAEPQAGAAELIGAAYKKWDIGCVDHMIGDFALAVWDRRRRHLFCARDHFGVRPFFYRLSDGDFCFASEIAAVIEGAPDPLALNEHHIAGYLEDTEQDRGATFYTSVNRLPPGTSLIVRGGHVQKRIYWQPSYTLSENIHERFRPVFEEAVRCRLGPDVGAMLSGGLDSSSIVCVAAPMVEDGGAELPTFHLTDRGDACSEESYVDLVADRYRISSRKIVASRNIFADFDDLLREQGEPFPAIGLAVTRSIYKAAASAGLGSLLNGHGGDEVVSHGFGRLGELACAGRVGELWRQSRGMSRLYGQPAWGIFSNYLLLHSVAHPARRFSRAVKHRVRGGQQPAGFVNRDLADRTGLSERLRQQARLRHRSSVNETSNHLSTIGSSRQARAFESLDHTARAHGIEPRYPFWDKRLVELCLSAPPHEKLDNGWSRLILRKSMEGILPPAIQWRADKKNFAPRILSGLLEALERDPGVLRPQSSLAAYADVAAIQSAVARFAAKGASGTEIGAVWRALTFGRWLDLRRMPVVKGGCEITPMQVPS